MTTTEISLLLSFLVTLVLLIFSERRYWRLRNKYEELYGEHIFLKAMLDLFRKD